MNELKPKILLVVEDDPGIRSSLALTLEFDGYYVTEAESGNAALVILRKQSVDLVISDIQMPDGDGLSLLAEVRRTIKDPPPFIFVSGHAEITEDEVKALGAIALVRKPFNIDELLKRIRVILSRN